MARPRLGDSESKRLQMVITEDELKAIEDWQFANRVPSKSEAIRRLCKIALLTEDELEDIVDLASECLDGITDQLNEASFEMKMIVNPSTADILFGQEEVGDMLASAMNRASIASDAIEGLHHMIVTLYNAIAPLAESKTISAGTEESRRKIEEANAVAERAQARRKEQEVNRYIGIIATTETPAERQRYLELPEDEQETYLNEKIAALAAEEAADPAAFADRYVDRPFWEEAGWGTKLRERAKQREEDDNGNS